MADRIFNGRRYHDCTGQPAWNKGLKTGPSPTSGWFGKSLSKEHRENISKGMLKGKAPADQTGRTRAQNRYPGEIVCRICNKPAERHHKDQNPNNNEPSNIDFLCRKHHIEEDRKRLPNGRLTRNIGV